MDKKGRVSRGVRPFRRVNMAVESVYVGLEDRDKPYGVAPGGSYHLSMAVSFHIRTNGKMMLPAVQSFRRR